MWDGGKEMKDRTGKCITIHRKIPANKHKKREFSGVGQRRERYKKKTENNAKPNENGREVRWGRREGHQNTRKKATST